MDIKYNEQIRISRMEAVCNQIRSEMDDVLQKAYDRAVAENDEENAAYFARKIRNKLLSASDKEMQLDRIGLDVSSTSAFLSSLRGIYDNSWSVYRQNLRDITKQRGFPFEIDWGTPPTNNSNKQ